MYGETDRNENVGGVQRRNQVVNEIKHMIQTQEQKVSKKIHALKEYQGNILKTVDEKWSGNIVIGRPTDGYVNLEWGQNITKACVEKK